MLIEIARDFTRTPGPRFERLGPYSGEAFGKELIKALRAHPTEVIEVLLDGTEGYGSSFLEEAFGGVVRAGVIPPAELRHRLKIRAASSIYRTYADEANLYFSEALDRAKI